MTDGMQSVLNLCGLALNSAMWTILMINTVRMYQAKVSSLESENLELRRKREDLQNMLYCIEKHGDVVWEEGSRRIVRYSNGSTQAQYAMVNMSGNRRESSGKIWENAEGRDAKEIMSAAAASKLNV